MKKRTVIKSEFLPTKAPIATTIFLPVALDYYQTSLFWQGVIYFALIMIWIVVVLDTLHSDQKEPEFKK